MTAKIRSFLDFSNKDLSGCDFTGANFTNAYLTGANFTGANLTTANLKGADLWNCIGNGKEIKNIKDLYYQVSYTKDIIFIGCEGHTFEEWENFSDAEIDQMDRGDSLDFWKMNKKYILQTIKNNPAI